MSSLGVFNRSRSKPKARRGHGGPTPARKPRKAKPGGRAGAAGRGGVRK